MQVCTAFVYGVRTYAMCPAVFVTCACHHEPPRMSHPTQNMQLCVICGCTHADIKPANVLLKSAISDPRGFVCKLSDFGLVNMLTPSGTPGGEVSGVLGAMMGGGCKHSPN
jgi:serine/threonine protein kinase